MKFSSFLSRQPASAWAGVLSVVLICTLPFGTRKLLGSAVSGFHEYEAFFLYASDIVAVCALIVGAWALRQRFMVVFNQQRALWVVLILFLLLVFVSVSQASLLVLSWYVAGRMAMLALLAFMAATLMSPQQWEKGLLVLMVATTLQSLIVIGQFFLQSSVGLSLLGEPVLAVSSPAASTIVIEGGRILRAYGTFPHPNVVGLFLVFGLLTSLFMYIRHTQNVDQRFQGIDKAAFLALGAHERWSLGRRYVINRLFAYKMMSIALFFIHACALVFTFSRSAWLAGIVGIIALMTLSRRTAPRAAGKACIVVLIAGACLWAVARPYISPRAHLQRTEPAVTERIGVYEVGLKMLKAHPYGVGIGNQVATAVKEGWYQEGGMRRVWQWEPVHNLLMLATLETGILGGLLFLVFLLWSFVGALRTPALISAVASSLFLATMTAGLFDHYLWTLQPGRLMLWGVIALCLSLFYRGEEGR